ncbi:MAG: histidine--tRNA ligase [Cyclobacteriaceae bacterium]|nr:histidine--tRNA ligase [Cyclobacteriaceae bacterium]
MEKPSIPKGTRDFGPEKMARRNFIFDTIKETFQKYGFMPLETPAMENLSVLTGKYGNEGDQLLFKVLNSGDFLAKSTEENRKDYKSLLPDISEKGLRYDLTVPFARFVVMNRNDLVFPFKRYQIQPVWRADRPQKGRYREFYQCDADVVGTDSLLCEAENIFMICDVFKKLGIKKFSIRLNHRKILSGISEVADAPGKENALCIAIDKLDKIGEEKVYEELAVSGFSDKSIEKLRPLFQVQGNNDEKLSQISEFLGSSQQGKKGVDELKTILSLASVRPEAMKHIDIDLTLARGLGYYTGAIFEVKALEGSISSSISGGGRYDNLTGVFGLDGVSGVGFSFGVDRIYDVMEDLGIFPESALEGPKAMIAYFEDSFTDAFALLHDLRHAGISTEMYPEAAKMKKQLSYADKKQIPFVIMAGPGEFAQNVFGLKNMRAGSQDNLNKEELINRLKMQ